MAPLGVSTGAIFMELDAAPTLSVPPLVESESVGAMATEFPLLILKEFADNKLKVCAVCVGRATVFVLGPTVSTLPVKVNVGAMATEFPLLMLRVFGDNRFKVCDVAPGKATELPPEILKVLPDNKERVGVEETVKFGCVPLTLTLVPGVMVVAGTVISKELVPVLEILIPPPKGFKLVFGVATEVPLTTETVFEPTVRTLFVKLTAGLMSTVLPPLMLRVPGARMFNVGVEEMV